MTRFPSHLKHCSDDVELDTTRLLLAFRQATDRDAIDAQLAELGLDFEDAFSDRCDDGGGMAQRVNHTDTRFWVGCIRGRAIDTARVRAIRAAFGAALDWIGPVYRSDRGDGAIGLFCPLPNVVLVKNDASATGSDRARARLLRALAGLSIGRGDDAATRAVTADAHCVRLHEQAEKSRHLHGFRYFVIENPEAYDAYRLRDQLLQTGTERVLEVRLETMPMIVPCSAVALPDARPLAPPDVSLEGPQAAWEIAPVSASQVLCVLDDGCDLTHPDLRCAGTGIDLATMAGDGAPTGPHGSACAAIAAATFNNSAAAAGVRDACRVLPVAFRNWTDVEVATGISYAAAAGARVISMSFGWNGWDRAIIDPAIAFAFDADVVLCAATHNHDGPITYPATNPLVMAVGACDGGDARRSRGREPGGSWGSNFGPAISVVAPPVRVPALDVRRAGGYAPDIRATMLGGTSSATPQVAGLAAVLRSAQPQLTNVAVRAIIERTAERVGARYATTAGHPNGPWNQEMGYGRINVIRALDCAAPVIDDIFVPGDEGRPQKLVPGQANHVHVRVTNTGPRPARNVGVSVRVAPYVGTEFVDPVDWADPCLVSPAALQASFASIPAGGHAIARFVLCAEQVALLHADGWQPTMLARVRADNDFAGAREEGPIGAGPAGHALRNASVVDVRAGETAVFPLLAGHATNADRTLELVVDRTGLPAASALLLALDDGDEHFAHVDLADRANLGGLEDDGTVLVDEMLLMAQIGRSHGVLTLAKGSRFDCLQRTRVGDVSVSGGEVILRAGKRHAEIRDARAVLRIEKAPRELLPLALAAQIPAGAVAGARYRVEIAQRNERHEVVGGASVVFRVV